MNKKAILFATFAMTFFSCGGIEVEKYIPPTMKQDTIPAEKNVYKNQAKQLYDLISERYLIKSGTYKGLFLENYPIQSGDPEHSYLWNYVSLMSGVSLLNQLGYNVNYADKMEGFERYYSVSGVQNVGGYSSSTNGTSGTGTRFYDDNSIVGLEMLRAYDQLKDSKFLDHCRQIVAFLKSGEDEINGNALWWNEAQKNIAGNTDSNKPACANGFACNFLLKYYQVCPSDEKANVLAFAKRLYTWLYNNLRDTEDNTYWNDMQVDKTINKTKWTYNSGVMISNGIQLYRITGDQNYLSQAIKTAEGAYNYFVRPRGNMALAYPDSDPWFNTKLFDAYIELVPYNSTAANYVDTYIHFMNNAITSARTSDGFFYEDWTGGSPKRYYSLLTQGAALESLARIAIYKGETTH